MDKNIHNQKVEHHFDRIYREWDKKYEHSNDIAHYELHRRLALTHEYINKYLKQDEATIIEIGCGTARNLMSILEQHDKWTGVGLDISEAMINYCTTTFAHEKRVSFEPFNLDEHTSYPITADVLIAMGVWGYLVSPERAVEFVSNTLKPGGVFMFTINKPSIPRFATGVYRSIRRLGKKNRATSLNQAYAPGDVVQWLDGRFEILATADYSYLPYIPVIRRWLAAARKLEDLFGANPTLLSRTTMYVTRLLPE